jgi:peptidoglycan/LPS O-acetylase OafA/YrhL
MVSFLANERTLPGRLLTAAPMLFIAKISYSIYIWHTLVINYFEKTALANMEKFWLSAGATVLVSAASYYVIEKPFLRYKTVKRGGAV